MKAIVQRCSGPCTIKIKDASGLESLSSFSGAGLVVLLGWERGDELKPNNQEEAFRQKIKRLRIFPDRDGKMNLNLSDYLELGSASGGILWVPQFTLAAELKSGFRPSYSKALAPELAAPRFDAWRQSLEAEESNYKHIFGQFGAEMNIEFCNWGPVTIPLSL